MYLSGKIRLGGGGLNTFHHLLVLFCRFGAVSSAVFHVCCPLVTLHLVENHCRKLILSSSNVLKLPTSCIRVGNVELVSIVGLSVIRDGEETEIPCISSVDPLDI